ncbi:MAG: Ig-like domain repeat protein [Terriglobia bacterium]|nr:Ig-like domain repeat protein [Terriglobia bacterium]
MSKCCAKVPVERTERRSRVRRQYPQQFVLISALLTRASSLLQVRPFLSVTPKAPVDTTAETGPTGYVGVATTLTSPSPLVVAYDFKNDVLIATTHDSCRPANLRSVPGRLIAPERISPDTRCEDYRKCAAGVPENENLKLQRSGCASSRHRALWKLRGPWTAWAAGFVLMLGCAPVADAQPILFVMPTANASTVAGTGTAGYAGDNGAATKATFASPGAVANDSKGDLFIADTNNNVIREVSATGVVTTVAGNGEQGFSGDGGAATSAELNAPTGIAVNSSGNLYIADSQNNRIREVSNGTITTVAGSGGAGFSGDGGTATSAELDLPTAVAVDTAGNLYIADMNNQRIREVSSGNISTVAGNGEQGYGGDGGSATSAQLDTPTGVAVDASGNIYIADSHNNRVREVSSGKISTVAGSGPVGLSGGFSGDGGDATAAQLAKPTGVAIDAAGNIYIADTNSNRLREVGNGAISTVAGTGVQGYGGDGGAATSALLNNPSGVAINSSGNAAIADALNERIRSVDLPMLTYASQAVGITSSPQDVTIANSGSGTLTVQSLNVTGAFATASGGTCSALPISLSTGQSCTQAIVFQPATAGTSQGSLVVGGSAVVPQTILLSGSTTQSTAVPQLTSSLNPSAWGNSITFTATVGTGSTPTPTGTITFSDGATALQTVTMSGGSASFATSALSVGSHSITAAYSGDAAWVAKTSAALTQVVSQATPLITLTASSSSAFLDNPVVLTAGVASSSGTPTGTVTFLDGTATIGHATLNAGQAAITVSTLTAGAHSITATYSGSTDFTSVTSSAVSEQVDDFNLKLASGGASSVSVAPGGTTTFKFVISPVGANTLPQSINLSASGLPSGAVATFSPATVTAGSGDTTVTLSIQTSNTAAVQAPLIRRGQAPLYLGFVLLPFAGIKRRWMDCEARASRQRTRRLRMFLLVMALSLAAFAGITGCGSKSGFFAHASQNSTITVTGTAGALSHSTTVQLDVK